jgi:hypothetical protein
MTACRLMGHRPRFRADGATLAWNCARGCGAHGLRRYATAREADRSSRAFDPRTATISVAGRSSD